MQLKQLTFNLSGKAIGNTVQQLFEAGLLQDAGPVSIEMDYHAAPVHKDWVQQYLPVTEKKLVIKWADELQQELRFYKGGRLWINIEHAVELDVLLRFLSQADFELASFETLYPEWEEIDPDYIAPGFSDGHCPHGWACAFKGEGHKRMVSRRWLKHGPWKDTDLGNDTTLVQFHELPATAATALKQAKPGHELIGISETGGFIQTDYLFEYDLKGIYEAEERLLKIVVHGAALQPRQLLDYCAAKLYNKLGDDKPIERIAIIFIEKAQAEAELHRLWLYGLECRAIEDGKEIRLDEGYGPPVTKPAWVNK